MLSLVVHSLAASATLEQRPSCLVSCYFCQPCQPLHFPRRLSAPPQLFFCTLVDYTGSLHGSSQCRLPSHATTRSTRTRYRRGGETPPSRRRRTRGGRIVLRSEGMAMIGIVCKAVHMHLKWDLDYHMEDIHVTVRVRSPIVLRYDITTIVRRDGQVTRLHQGKNY
jgi:hypothetical protein